MKFEEVLPKMRDEGRIGKVGESLLFKISSDGRLWIQVNPISPWRPLQDLNEEYLTKDLRSLLPIEIKRWDWIFGNGCKSLFFRTGLTKEQAENKRIFHEYEWSHPIPQTLREEE